MDPNKGRKPLPPKTSSNYSGQGIGQSAGQIGQAPSNLTILSSILRAPHPSLQKGTAKPQEASVGLSQMAIPRPRGHSPIRVITTSINQGTPNMVSKVGGGISPSRIPTTLPPKKSLSPSRTICSEAQTQSPKHRVTTPPRNLSPASTVASLLAQGQGRHTQSQILSHLPYLQQTLQSNTVGTPEKLFQLYNARKTADQPQGAISAQMMHNMQEKTSPPPSHIQPRPAHQSQRVPTPPPHHVPTIRRTPSPAHMPIGADTKAKVLVEHTASQAVNLIKSSESGETKWSDADFKYGDLLKSINKSHDAIQAPLLQRGLSPITPAEQVDKPWKPPSHMHASLHAPTAAQSKSSISMSAIHSSVSSSMRQSHQVTSSGQYAPVSIPIPTASSYSSVAQVGFTPVVLPTHAQRMSPKGAVRQSTSPKSRPIAVVSSSSMPVHTVSSQQPAASYVHVPVPSSGVHSEMKVFPSRDLHRYTAVSLDTSVTQAGPPNITISSSSNILPHDKPLTIQKHPRNPFTFPATPPASLTNERSLSRAFVQTSQLKAAEEDKIKERHVSEEMPCLSPVREKKLHIKSESDSELVEIPQPYNMRLQNLANFPNNSAYRPTYRATSVAIHKAKVGCITNSAKSLDILRLNLQKSINKEIDAVIQNYINKFFKIGIENIKLNNGETSVTDDHVQAVCRQILEEAKKMYITETTSRVSVSPSRDFSDNLSETGSSGRRSALGRRRHPSDTDSETSLRPGNKKKKGRNFSSLTGRSTPSKLTQQQCKREGPKFDPERLTEETQFVMGSKANKAMGFGATRGRLYMKHPDLFKYGGDQDDKTWLYEHQHMPATGGKSYLIVLDDVKELILTDEYRDAPGINISTLNGFTVPIWMIEKMRTQMVAMRTDLPKQQRYRSRSTTPNEPHFLTEVDDGHSPPKDLPFSSFSSPKPKRDIREASPANELEFLADTTEPDDAASPFNMTGGFDDGASQSDMDTLDEAPFGMAK